MQQIQAFVPQMEHFIFQLVSRSVLKNLRLFFWPQKETRKKQPTNPPPTNLSRSLTPSVSKPPNFSPHGVPHGSHQARNSDANQFPCWYWVDQYTSHEANEWTYGNEGVGSLQFAKIARTLGGLSDFGSFFPHLKNHESKMGILPK